MILECINISETFGSTFLLLAARKHNIRFRNWRSSIIAISRSELRDIAITRFSSRRACFHVTSVFPVQTNIDRTDLECASTLNSIISIYGRMGLNLSSRKLSVLRSNEIASFSQLSPEISQTRHALSGIIWLISLNFVPTRAVLDYLTFHIFNPELNKVSRSKPAHNNRDPYTTNIHREISIIQARL